MAAPCSGQFLTGAVSGVMKAVFDPVGVQDALRGVLDQVWRLWRVPHGLNDSVEGPVTKVEPAGDLPEAFALLQQDYDLLRVNLSPRPSACVVYPGLGSWSAFSKGTFVKHGDPPPLALVLLRLPLPAVGLPCRQEDQSPRPTSLPRAPQTAG
jgi:hypothetical protein